MDHKTDILNSGLVPMVVEQTPRGERAFEKEIKFKDLANIK